MREKESTQLCNYALVSVCCYYVNHFNKLCKQQIDKMMKQGYETNE